MDPLPPPGPIAAIVERLTRRGRVKEPTVCRGERSEYAIVAIVDSGSACCVFRAIDLRTERPIALKVVLDEPRAGTSRALYRFENELTVLARLRHPNIVHALDRGEVGGRPFYTMDFAERGSLGQMLRRDGALSPSATARYLLEVLDALGYAHELGIIHRDVKPDNILIDETDVARLVDFGIALDPETERSTSQGESLGTPAYISPEQVVDPGSVGPPADLFGVGATLFALVTAQNPLALVSRAHRKRALDQVPGPLREIVDTSTRPRPEGRYRTASEMAFALADADELLR